MKLTKRLRSQILDIIERCYCYGWDGNGADPCDIGSLRWSLQLIKKIPQIIREPYVRLDNHGQIFLLWEQQPSSLEIVCSSKGRAQLYYLNPKVRQRVNLSIEIDHKLTSEVIAILRCMS